MTDKTKILGVRLPNEVVDWYKGMDAWLSRRSRGIPHQRCFVTAFATPKIVKMAKRVNP